VPPVPATSVKTITWPPLARTSLLVGVVAVTASSIFGTALGVTAGYFGGWWDSLVMRVVDVWQAIPYLVLALAIAVVLGPGLETLIFVLVLGTWTTFARVLRGEALVFRASEAVLAARVLGATHRRILVRHVVLHLSGSLAVLTSLTVGSTILFEASPPTLAMKIVLVPKLMLDRGRLRLHGTGDELDVVAATGYQAADAFGPQRSDDAGGTASPVVACQRGSADLESIHQRQKIVAQHGLLSRARGVGRQEARGAVAAKVGCNDTTACLNQMRRDLVVGVNIVREPVQQHDGRAILGTTLFVGNAEYTRIHVLQHGYSASRY